MKIRTDDPPGGQPSERRRKFVSALISAVALLLVAIHLLHPKANIDAITLVLIAVAALPWLGAIFKSIELPGIGRVEYQELRREQQQTRQEVAQLQDSVKRVERVIFSREVSPDLAQQLGERIELFHNYLAALQLAPYENEPPQIGLELDRTGSLYYAESNRIEISPDLADNPHVLFREYCNYALALGNRSKKLYNAAYDLKSGLAFYFPCSFTGEPGGFVPFGVTSMIQGR